MDAGGGVGDFRAEGGRESVALLQCDGVAADIRHGMGLRADFGREGLRMDDGLVQRRCGNQRSYPMLCANLRERTARMMRRCQGADFPYAYCESTVLRLLRAQTHHSHSKHRCRIVRDDRGMSVRHAEIPCLILASTGGAWQHTSKGNRTSALYDG